MTFVLVGIGLAIIAVGVVGAAVHWDLGAAGWFLLAGCGLVGLATLYPRLQSMDVEVAGTKFGALFKEVADQAGSVAAVEIARLGMADLAAAYQFIHFEGKDILPDSGTRIGLLDALIQMATERSVRSSPKKRALTAAMHSESPAARAIAVGIAREHLQLINVKAITPNLNLSKSANEQYHALSVAKGLVPTLSQRDLRTLRDVLVNAPHMDGEDRRKLREEVVGTIDARLQNVG